MGGPSMGSYIDNTMVDVFPVHTKSGELAGKVTSACYSPRMEKNIGLAMVSIEHTDIGTELQVDAPSGRVDARVVPKPFVDPTKEIPKQ
jgi:glycine cleavage system aminomethyltransferase T